MPPTQGYDGLLWKEIATVIDRHPCLLMSTKDFPAVSRIDPGNAVPSQGPHLPSLPDIKMEPHDQLPRMECEQRCPFWAKAGMPSFSLPGPLARHPWLAWSWELPAEGGRLSVSWSLGSSTACPGISLKQNRTRSTLLSLSN